MADLFKTHQKTTLYLLLALLIIVSGWLLYQKYLKPIYSLQELVPSSYQISLAVSLDRFSLPKIEQRQLLKNPALAEIYNKLNQQIENQLNQLPTEAQKIIKSGKETIIFFNNPDEFGLIIKIPLALSTKKIEQTDFGPWQKTILKKEILLVSNNPDLLAKMASQKISSASNPYFSLTLNPWLKINLQKTFFEANYQKTWLADLQAILLPLNFSSATAYQLAVNAQGKNLNLILTPQTPLASTANLEAYTKLIAVNPELVIGLADLPEFAKNLENNENLKNLWSKLDGRLFLNQQISLSALLKKISAPVTLVLGQNFWQIITDASQAELTRSLLTGYLAQFQPKEKAKTLPDGSRAIELVADPAKVTWQEQEINGWQVWHQDTAGVWLGWGINNNKLVISNRLNQLSSKPLNLNCGEQPANTTIVDLFYLKGQSSGLKLANILQNFSYFGSFTYSNGQINLCLGLD